MVETTMRESFVRATEQGLDEDPRLAVVLAAISGEQLASAARQHPERVVDVGIREQAMIGVAGGMALTGMRPVVHTYAPFLVERPFEQLKLDLGHQDVGAVLVSLGASYDAAVAGRTHMSPADVALLDSLPGWTVHVPGHPDEATTLLRSAFAGDDRVYVRLSERINDEPHSPGLHVLRRGGRGVVLAVGPTLRPVLAATADMDVTVLYTATARPFDGAGLRAALPGSPDVVLVEPYLAGTSAHLVGDALGDIPHRVLSLGVRRDRELRAYGAADDHEAAHGLDAAGIGLSVRRFLAV